MSEEAVLVVKIVAMIVALFGVAGALIRLVGDDGEPPDKDDYDDRRIW